MPDYSEDSWSDGVEQVKISMILLYSSSISWEKTVRFFSLCYPDVAFVFKVAYISTSYEQHSDPFTLLPSDLNS